MPTPAVPFKMLYRYKVAIFAGLVASFTFLLAYVTGPKSSQEPVIRVLYISFSDHGTVKRTLSVKQNPSIDDAIQILKVSGDGSITIDRELWDLRSTSEEFFENNLVLECTSSFPITWKYTGFGDPFVTEKNVRIHGNFNDSTTFTYLSLLNLMPLTEKSTGLYTCFGASNDTSQIFTSVQIYVPGDMTFLIDYDTVIEAPGENQIIVPCPVTNTSAMVSLYFKNQMISGESMENLLSFNPKSGFYLTPKFVEQQSEPWGQFYCKNEETKEKSGVITIQPKKGLLVNAIPETKIVFIQKPKRGSKPTSNLEEKYKFVCQAKEEITLKFLRVVTNPMVNYDYNSSSTFPFSAYTEVTPRNLKNSSKIYCRTVRNNEDLHSWKVLFSSLSAAQRTESMDFRYDIAREDFSCCSSSNKKAKLTVVNCNSLSECRIKGNCLLPGRKCDPEKVLLLPERTGCVRYKMQRYDKTINNDNGRSYKEIEDYSSFIDSGLIQCSIDGKNVERIFFAAKYSSENGSQLSIVSGEVGLSSTTLKASNFGLDTSSINADSYLQITELGSTKQRPGLKRYVCRGAKFFLAVGFLWQTIHTNNEIKFHFGRDTVKGEWIQSQIELSTTPLTHGITTTLKRIYCVAPLWNSDGEWVHMKVDIAT